MLVHTRMYQRQVNGRCHFNEAAIVSSLFFAASRSSRSLRAFLLVVGSLMMLGGTPAGDAYTFAELETMFRNAGFAQSKLHELPPTIQRVVISQK